MIGRATIVALLPSFEQAALLVPELGRVGLARPDIFAASLDRRGLAEFGKRHGISQLDILDNGDPATRHLWERVPGNRVRYFTDRLEGANVLLVLPNVENGTAVSTLLERAGADFGPSLEQGDFKDVRVPLRAEHLEIVKHLVQNGTVRLHKETITEIERYDVRLVREELVIERTGLDSAGTVETLRIPLQHEEARVSKKTVVTNEVVVRRQQFEETCRIEEPVRYERISVTKEGDVTMREAALD